MALNASQQEFHDLLKKKDALIKDLAPLQKEYDTLRAEQQEIAKKLVPIKDKLKTAKAPIAEIDIRRAQIARSLSGQTGKPE